MPLTIRFLGNSDQVLVRQLTLKAPQILERLTAQLTEEMIFLQGVIQTEKLSGQILQHKSGKLIGSVRAVPAVLSGGFISAEVDAAGGPAWYGSLFEYGTEEGYDIFPHTRTALKFVDHGSTIFAKAVHHPPILRKAFMGPTLTEMAPTIAADLQAALNEVLNEPIT